MMNDTENIIGVKPLHSGAMSLEQRVEILEELLLVKPPASMASPAVTKPGLRTDVQIEEIDDRIETLENGLQDLETECSEVMYKVQELENVGMSSDEVTDRIKHYLKTFLRNSLGLEVSFDDKR
jgi:hypothetical protein